jgi:hypothetical protein
MKTLFALGLLFFVATATTQAQTAADSAGIKQTALDYIDGWYTGDAARMERAVHPELAKRNVTTDDRRHVTVTLYHSRSTAAILPT